MQGEVRLENVLEPGEVEAVLAVARQWALGGWDNGEVWRVNVGVYAHIALLTGLRVSEICRARWEDWYPDRGYARVWCHKRRRGVSLCGNGNRGRRTEVFRGVLRTIPLCDRLCAFLREVGRRQGDVIVSEIKPGHRRRRLAVDAAALLRNRIYRIQRTWPDLLEAAGVRRVRLHDARHTFGTRVYERTRDIVGTSRLLGHADIGTTMAYMHSRGQRRLVNDAFG